MKFLVMCSTTINTWSAGYSTRQGYGHDATGTWGWSQNSKTRKICSTTKAIQEAEAKWNHYITEQRLQVTMVTLQLPVAIYNGHTQNV